MISPLSGGFPNTHIVIDLAMTPSAIAIDKLSEHDAGDFTSVGLLLAYKPFFCSSYLIFL